jgi:hypothetical protein
VPDLRKRLGCAIRCPRCWLPRSPSRGSIWSPWTTASTLPGPAGNRGRRRTAHQQRRPAAEPYVRPDHRSNRRIRPHNPLPGRQQLEGHPTRLDAALTALPTAVPREVTVEFAPALPQRRGGPTGEELSRHAFKPRGTRQHRHSLPGQWPHRTLPRGTFAQRLAQSFPDKLNGETQRLQDIIDDHLHEVDHVLPRVEGSWTG